MSAHDPLGPGEHDTAKVSDEVPRSKGVPPVMYLFFAVAFIFIAMQGVFVEMAAHDFHVWPATDSTKIQLPPAKL